MIPQAFPDLITGACEGESPDVIIRKESGAMETIGPKGSRLFWPSIRSRLY